MGILKQEATPVLRTGVLSLQTAYPDPHRRKLSLLAIPDCDTLGRLPPDIKLEPEARWGLP